MRILLISTILLSKVGQKKEDVLCWMVLVCHFLVFAVELVLDQVILLSVVVHSSTLEQHANKVRVCYIRVFHSLSMSFC